MGLPHGSRQAAVSTQWLEGRHFCLQPRAPELLSINWGACDSHSLGSVNFTERLTELRDTVITKGRVGEKGAQCPPGIHMWRSRAASSCGRVA